MSAIMKVIFAFVLFVSPLFAQDQAAAARAAAGCGPNEVKFTVKTDKTQHPTAQPAAGKAMVYVFGGETIDLGGLVMGKDGVTTRWGVDGVWVGAGYRNRSEEHTSELQSRQYLVCRLLLEKKKK